MNSLNHEYTWRVLRVTQSFMQPLKGIHSVRYFWTDAFFFFFGLQFSEELTGIFSPNILFNSKADYEHENRTLQEVQDHMEDKQMKVTNCKILARWVQEKMRRAIQMAL